MRGSRRVPAILPALAVGDHRRFDLFADLVTGAFPAARRVFDIAGGMGNDSLYGNGTLYGDSTNPDDADGGNDVMPQAMPRPVAGAFPLS